MEVWLVQDDRASYGKGVIGKGWYGGKPEWPKRTAASAGEDAVTACPETDPRYGAYFTTAKLTTS